MSRFDASSQVTTVVLQCVEREADPLLQLVQTGNASAPSAPQDVQSQQGSSHVLISWSPPFDRGGVLLRPYVLLMWL